jgi:hypothetical protein
MPLKRGYSLATINDNIIEMIGAGHSQASALAASYRSARDYFLKTYPHEQLPRWLIPKSGKRLRNPGELSITQKIKKMGGIELSAIKDISGERRTGKGIASIPPGLFTRNGRGLDDLAISLHDEGYPIDINDVDGGVADLAEMIRYEIDGHEKFYPGDPSERFEKQYAEYYGQAEPEAPRKTKPRAPRKAARKAKPKRRPSFDLADRASRATGLPPSRRLVARRMRNNQPGYFPNPRHPLSAQVAKLMTDQLLKIYNNSGLLAARNRYQQIVHDNKLTVSQALDLARRFQHAATRIQTGTKKNPLATMAALHAAASMGTLATMGRGANPVPPSRKVQIRNAAKLYEDFTGHEASEYQTLDKPVLPDVMLQVGDIDFIGYTTVRDGKTEKYIHKFSKKCRPLFTVSHDGKQLFMLGGSYDFTELGIVDKT